MRNALIAAAIAATALAPALKADHEIKLQGCVVPGLDKGTFALTQVSEVGAGALTIPEVALGRRVMFWLTDAKKLRDYVGRMVEVRGKIEGDAKESEIEVKAGPREDGGLIVEFEGPGKNVRVPAETVSDAVGTSGRTEPGKDIKTYLVKVNVDHVDTVKNTPACLR
jgi:hypothetical protein